MFNEQIMLSGILLYIGNALKNIPMQIWSLIKSRLGVTIYTDSKEDMVFDNLNKWLIALDKKALNNHVKIITGYDYLTAQLITHKTVGNGKFIICKNKTIIVIDKTKIKDVNQNDNGRLLEEISVFLIGIHAYKLRDEINDYINKTEIDNDRSYIEVKRGSNFGGYNSSYINKRDFSSIFCHDKDLIINHLDRYPNNESLYKSHGLTHKTGILLYGEPGTGKSSIAKVIASYLNYDIISTDISASKALELRTKLENLIKPKSVILFEDIDCVMDVNRKSDNDSSDEKKAKLGVLLNFLDGIDSPNNVVFVATTNHIEDLDPALIREGRFDLKIEMKKLDEELAIDMCNSFDVDCDDILEDVEFPISPVELQNKIIRTII